MKKKKIRIFIFPLRNMTDIWYNDFCILRKSAAGKESVKMKHPTREKCRQMLDEYGTPDHVRRHCGAVAQTAYTIAEALNNNGFDMDLDLITAAGMLHDIARVKDRHWDVAADYLKDLGFREESEIIRVHMTYSPFSQIEDADETDMLCLGDRLVREDEYVGIDKRIQYIIDKAVKNGHEEKIPFILEKKKDTLRFMNQIENRIGKSIDELMKGK